MLDNVGRKAIRKFPDLWKSHDDQIELHGRAVPRAPRIGAARKRTSNSLGIYKAALSAIAKVGDCCTM